MQTKGNKEEICSNNHWGNLKSESELLILRFLVSELGIKNSFLKFRKIPTERFGGSNFYQKLTPSRMLS